MEDRREVENCENEQPESKNSMVEVDPTNEYALGLGLHKWQKRRRDLKNCNNKLERIPYIKFSRDSFIFF